MVPSPDRGQTAGPNTESTALRVRSSESVHRWATVSRVSVALAWPSRACTVFTDSPCRIRRLA